MSDPLVAVVMLTRDRPQFVRRGIASFLSQTYANKYLYILDSGKTPCVEALPDGYPDLQIQYHRTSPAARSIGPLRNYANQWQGQYRPDIIAHADDDDWYGPTRLAEQVALLQTSGKDAVGYRDVLFWDTTRKWEMVEDAVVSKDGITATVARVGEAWLYTNPDPRYCIGSSLMYWRTAWEKRPFQPRDVAEDTTWLHGVKSIGVSAGPQDEPRMIASIHGANTCSKVTPKNRSWRRWSEYDATCRRLMAL